MTTTLVGTAYRIEGIALGAGDVIAAGSSLTTVELRTVDPDNNDFQVTPRSVIFEGTVNETVLREAEAIDFFADGVQIASESPAFEFVSLNTDAGTVFGITFSAGGDTYFLPRGNVAPGSLTSVTGDSQIRSNNVAFNQLEFGLLPEGSTAFEGRVFGNGAIDAPGLGSVRTVIDTDSIARNPENSTEIDAFNASVLVTVEFADGTSLGGVRALQLGQIDFVNNQNIDSRAFALDVATLNASGQSLDTVVNAEFESFANHTLSYADIGFAPRGTTPVDDNPTPTPDPEPTPEPTPEVETIVIEGGNGRDRLYGSDADEVIIGGKGSDVLRGGDGADTFVFGADSSNGARERDVIVDFDASEDVIVLEEGTSVRRAFERNGDLHIQLDGGDRDRIILRDNDKDALDSIVFTNDDFLV